MKGIWIAIGGKAGHGKDTIGEIVQELWSEKNYKPNMKPAFYDQFQVVKFADPINRAIHGITGLPLVYIKDRANYNVVIPWLNKSIRDLKQQIGEGMKKILGESVWVKSAFSRVSRDANIVVTDTRFPLELDFLLAHQAINIFVERPDYEDETVQGENANHTSETSVKLLDKSKFDCIIINNGTRAELKEKVKEFLKTRKEWKTLEEIKLTSSKRDF